MWVGLCPIGSESSSVDQDPDTPPVDCEDAEMRGESRREASAESQTDLTWASHFMPPELRDHKLTSLK